MTAPISKAARKTAFAIGAGLLSFSTLAMALPSRAVTTESTVIAQVEANQDNLQMQCPGSIGVNDVNFRVLYTREAGFSRIILTRRSTGQTIAETKNDKGQAIWRGSVNGAADVTLVHLSTRAPQGGDQVSVGYDMQWGRGTCARSTTPL